MNRITLKPISIALLAAALLSVVTIALVSGRSDAADDKSKASTAPTPALTVTTIKPSQADVPVRLTANGNIAAWQEAIIGSESNGLRLAEVRANVGDMVRAGQVLASFADESVKADGSRLGAGHRVDCHRQAIGEASQLSHWRHPVSASAVAALGRR